MKRVGSSRRGSALLIVLGILSFMVVSAVAFSVLMRQSRLPSSFLRQKVASSYLVKAALANAMAEIDKGIGDDPYPGERLAGSTNNYWRSRIYTGTNDLSGVATDDDILLPNAVATMPFEGLAYIPPPLINTVRNWMKRLPTAVWKPLDYDAGRYAYTAINVSDYFDVNRLKANVMRDSTAAHRISLAYLFEEEPDHEKFMSSLTPEKFEDEISSARSGDSGLTTNFVSMADYALAMYALAMKDSASLPVPFLEYITSRGAQMYTETTGGTDYEKVRLQKFVTDSWYPTTNQTATTTALTDLQNQPFESVLNSVDALILDPLNDQTILKHLNFPERVAFCDYLDGDDVPLSLALPTIEHTPMLTGLSIKPVVSTFAFKVEQANDSAPPEEEKDTDGKVISQTTHRLWKITGFDGDPTITASATAVFPFKGTANKFWASKSFKVEILVKAYLVPDGGEAKWTRVPDDSQFSCRPTVKNWAEDWRLLDKDAPCLTFFGSGDLKLNEDAKKEKDALLMTLGITLKTKDWGNGVECPIYGVTVKTYMDGLTKPEVKYDATRITESEGKLMYFEDLKSSAATPFDDKQKLDGRQFRWQFFA